jgi:hypothetical protein
VQRRHDGTVAGSAAAAALGRRGGLQTAKNVRLVDSLGLSKLVESTSFGPYRTAAEAFVRHHLDHLATMAGGSVGPAPSTMVASAALQLAASRWAFDRGAEANDASLIKLGSTLANDSRQNLLASYQLAVLEAKSRPSDPDERPIWLVDADDPDAQRPPRLAEPEPTETEAEDT